MDRTIEDRLREEYFDLLPVIHRVAWQLETQIRFETLPTLHDLRQYEHLIVKSRVKDCVSAVRALERRQEGNTFNSDTPEVYSLLDLPDLVGVRVLVFPRNRVMEVDQTLRRCFPNWNADPVPDGSGSVLAFKYSGICEQVSQSVRAEYQIVPMLIGLFWEVEHSAMYKPHQTLRGIAESRPMRALRTEVEQSLLHFEEGFEGFVRDNANPEAGAQNAEL